MHTGQLLALGLIAGGTIYIGLPIGRLQGLSNKVRSALSMLAVGVLIYLLVEILGEAAGQTSSSVLSAVGASRLTDDAVLDVLLLLGGLLIGLVGLVALQQRWQQALLEQGSARLPWMIASGIGLHNLSEGLAIGQSFALGQTGLAVGLVIGFALHNATEGFGIVAPAVHGGQRLRWRELFWLGAIGGGPTFIGTLLGSIWTSAPLSVFVLAMAGGAILYVVKELLAGVRKESAQRLMMSMLVVGFAMGWGTEVTATAHLSGDASGSGQGVVREADGDIISANSSNTAASHQTLKLTAQAAAAQDQLADDVLHEQALTPTLLPDGTKQFVLTASTFPWELYPGKVIQAWGYNQQVPGPLIHVKVGDKVAIVLKNNLPQPTTLHLHGLAVPNAMDGVPNMEMDNGASHTSAGDMAGMSMSSGNAVHGGSSVRPPVTAGSVPGTQAAIPPGGSFTYRFTVTPQMVGTHLYHTHVNDDFQMDMGLHGVLLVDPASPPPAPQQPVVDAVYEMASFKVDGSEQENVFTLDGKAYPEAPVLNVPRGALVHLRLVNASAEESHVMHLHGYTFKIVARDGNPLPQPESANTVLLGPSQTADIEFVADNPGNWMFHCHILDHTVNPGPESEGSAQKMADMGGLVTWIHVD
ncbi:MAG: multicopper oxidase domain-containing protein [Alicyclobacillus sp.]|nr:multicopper oxidase domain-containing protein [Alicyclobacillus sp.]